MSRGKVDPLLRGRQLRRYYDKHAAHDQDRGGFTDDDLAVMDRLCPLTGAADDEVEFPSKWTTKAQSVSKTISWWRGVMQDLQARESSDATVDIKSSSVNEIGEVADDPQAPLQSQQQTLSGPVVVQTHEKLE